MNGFCMKILISIFVVFLFIITFQSESFAYCQIGDPDCTIACSGSYTVIETPFSDSMGSGFNVDYTYSTICECNLIP